MQFHYYIQWWILRTLTSVYFRIKVHGLENIPTSGPIILAANHCSFLDPPLIGLGITRQVTFLAKEELFQVPLLGWWLSWIGSYPVARGKGDARILKTALRLLKEGKTLLIFPEGTRSEDGRVQTLESGLAWLALKSEVPVIPVYSADTYRLMPREARFPRPGRIRFHVGKPIQPKIDPEKDFHEQIHQLTMQIETVLKEKENELRSPIVG